MITIGIIAFEIMAYLFFVKKTPVMLARTDERAAGKASTRHAGGHLPPTLTSA
jgi:Ni/Fe-hydrogenase subunit HybB-like protein